MSQVPIGTKIDWTIACTLPLDTGAAAWTNTHLSKFSCSEIHNSHVHIGLDDTKLIK